MSIQWKTFTVGNPDKAERGDDFNVLACDVFVRMHILSRENDGAFLFSFGAYSRRNSLRAWR